jgi:site-specific recombinase XerD
MGEKEITEFLTHLAVRENVSSSTQNQALCALLFLYREVLQEDIGWLDDIERAKRSKRLPVVFTREEAKKILLRLEGT